MSRSNAAVPLQFLDRQGCPLLGRLGAVEADVQADRLRGSGSGERCDVLLRGPLGDEGTAFPAQRVPRDGRSGAPGTQRGLRRCHPVGAPGVAAGIDPIGHAGERRDHESGGQHVSRSGDRDDGSDHRGPPRKQDSKMPGSPPGGADRHPAQRQQSDEAGRSDQPRDGDPWVLRRQPHRGPDLVLPPDRQRQPDEDHDKGEHGDGRGSNGAQPRGQGGQPEPVQTARGCCEQAVSERCADAGHEAQEQRGTRQERGCQRQEEARERTHRTGQRHGWTRARGRRGLPGHTDTVPRRGSRTGSRRALQLSRRRRRTRAGAPAARRAPGRSRPGRSAHPPNRATRGA